VSGVAESLKQTEPATAMDSGNSAPLFDNEQYSDPDALLSRIRQSDLLVVNSRRRNGLILYKEHYAEFAGPGAAVGGEFDADCWQAIAVGDLSLVRPETYEERKNAYLIRRKWIQLTHKFTEMPVPLQRAQMIMTQFENYFDAETIARLPDEAFARLVGLLPQTVCMIRYTSGKLRSRNLDGKGE